MIKVENVSKAYQTPNGPLRIISDASFELAPGEALSIMGPSGSGKSTLLYIIGALEPPTSGAVTLDGVNPFTLRPKELAAFRNKQLGFVFQDHCLLPQCSVIENVLTPTLVAQNNGDTASRARDLLGRVGLSERVDHLPGQLSGGERQRTALARALIMKPRLVLCDEPTGNLDQKAAGVVADLLFEVHRDLRTSLIVVTHSPELAARCPRRFELRDGTLTQVS